MEEGLVVTPLRLSQAGRHDCLRWDAALRVGRPVVWTGAVPVGWTAAEVGPLVVDAPPEIMRWAVLEQPAPARAPCVTVVIPTHRCVPWAMRALRGQSWPTRTLVVCNGSGPRTVAGAEVWHTPWMGHAATRRAALERVQTPYVLLMTDDGIPRGRGFVASMMEQLVEGVDAVVARQVAWPTAARHVRERIRAWTPASPGAMPHADHVATLYRTDELRRWAVKEVPIAEDLAWTQERRVIRAPAAVVLHSHVPTVETLVRRRRAEHAVRARLGAPVPIEGFRAALSALPGTLGSGPPAAIVGSVAELIGMAWGAHEGRRAR
ncbi:MAG: hypothetical protein CL927_02450 [Deltaproteobacteria bacterium]|nr:hypothetical protein [Deltaproteobacteria bacterium]HCH66070.1 hypothetical protein [Deltaproteobacteria bacterium]